MLEEFRKKLTSRFQNFDTTWCFIKSNRLYFYLADPWGRVKLHCVAVSINSRFREGQEAVLNFAKCIFLILESTDFPFRRVLLCSNYRVNNVHLWFASPWVDPRVTHWKPGGMVQFWYFFKPADFTGPWGLTHRICWVEAVRQARLKMHDLVP